MSKTVLIADDEPNIVVSLEYLLRRGGYNVVVARDGEAGGPGGRRGGRGLNRLGGPVGWAARKT